MVLVHLKQCKKDNNMPQFLKKSLQKSSQKQAPKAKFAIHLSGLACVIIASVIVLAIGWSFFMGFMVGKGQNPQLNMEEMAAILNGKSEKTEINNDSNINNENNKKQEITQNTNIQENTKEQKQENIDIQNNQANQPPQLQFMKPEGESLSAWGIKQENQKDKNINEQSQKDNKRQTKEQDKVQNEPQFDYVFQVAAFKDKDDADKLRARLESNNLRTNIEKSGKVLLVLVNYRGQADKVNEIKDILNSLKLGNPILISKKPVQKEKPKPQKNKKK